MRALPAHAMTSDGARLLLVVADGVRPDVLEEEIAAGRAPTIAALQARGGSYTITSSFPSVTGPAYVPFMMGRNPGDVGMPGLRWFDRTRTLRWAPAAARSYAGIDIWHADRDVSRDAPTLLELARPSLAGMSMLGRGASLGNVGRSAMWCIRAAIPHFRGDTLGWRRVEQAATNAFLARFARERPRVSVLAITSPDKFSHAFGSRSESVRAAIADIDSAIARARHLAHEGGWLDTLRVWLVGDHGHAPVERHEDLHGWLEAEGHLVLCHPQLTVRNADIALMVGGNAMAHLYLDPSQRTRGSWGVHAPRWTTLHDALVARESVDLVAVSLGPDRVRVSHADRGSAELSRRDARLSYVADAGDPLGLGGTLRGLDACAAWMASSTTSYPDALVQLVSLLGSSRSGDIVLSAADGWDFRARFEPVDHVSTHGALLRDHMLVPLVLDGPAARLPMRTTDVVPSALSALGIETDAAFDGRSFV